VLGDVPVVCGHFGDCIVWKIGKDIIEMQKKKLCHVGFVTTYQSAEVTGTL